MTVNDDDITESALDYISRAMPEQSLAIRELFTHYAVEIQLTSEVDFQPGQGPQFSPEVAFSVIRWPPIMFSLMWVLAHGAWEAMRDYGSIVLSRYFSGAESVKRSEIENDASTLGVSGKALEAIDCAVQIAHGKAVDLPSWLPNVDNTSNIEQEAIRELWFLAIAWMLLHEFQHIVFKEQSTSFARDIDEELACDKAAFDWLLSKVDEFAGASRQPADKVRGKRAMGALIALFCIVWLSDRDESATHPPVIQRLSVLLAEIGEKEAGLFWEFAVGLMYVLDGNKERFTFPRPGTVRDVVLVLAKGLS